MSLIRFLSSLFFIVYLFIFVSSTAANHFLPFNPNPAIMGRFQPSIAVLILLLSLWETEGAPFTRKQLPHMLSRLEALQTGSRQSPPRSGLTFDRCRGETDCQGSLQCLPITSSSDCSTSSCRCVPKKFIPCSSSNQCPEGEVCARSVLTPFVCTSASLVASFNVFLATAEQEAKKPLVPDCKAPPYSKLHAGVPFYGTSADACVPGTCRHGLKCITVTGTGVECCPEGNSGLGCLCVPEVFRSCSSVSDCLPPEVCVEAATSVAQCYSLFALSQYPIEELRRLHFLR